VELPRVFGHLELVVEVSESGARARVSPLAVTRLIEARVEGLDPRVVPRVVSRICGVCSIAHQLASIEALEVAAGFEPSEAVELLRKALIAIHAVQNAAVFLAFVAFEEAGLGEASSARKGLIEVNNLCCRALTKLVGSPIHPPRLSLGGFPELPRACVASAIRDLELARKIVGEVVSEVRVAEERIVVEGTAVRVPNLSSRECVEALVSGSWRPLRLSPEVFERLASLEPPPFTGSRARLLATNPWTELAENPLTAITARVLELPMLIDTAIDCLDRAASSFSGAYERVEVVEGSGVAALEAPRGTLVHFYEVSRSRVSRCRILTPTQLSLRYVELCASTYASTLISRGAGLEEVERKVASLVRSFDPCIPCAVKVIRVG